MKWVKWGEYAIRAEGFSICKAKVHGDWIYTAFELPNKILGHYRKLDDAKSQIMEVIKSKPSKPDDLFSQPRLQPKLGSGYKDK
jgi:hypothetical protein